MDHRMMRLKSITKNLVIPRSSLYAQIKDGVFPRPVPIGDRAVAWPQYEVEAIYFARIAGKSKDQMRSLVSSLHQQRESQAEYLKQSEAPK